MKIPTKLREAPEQKGVLNDRLRQPERVSPKKTPTNLPRIIKGGEHLHFNATHPRAMEDEDRIF